MFGRRREAMVYTPPQLSERERAAVDEVIAQTEADAVVWQSGEMCGWRGKFARPRTAIGPGRRAPNDDIRFYYGVGSLEISRDGGPTVRILAPDLLQHLVDQRDRLGDALLNDVLG